MNDKRKSGTATPGGAHGYFARMRAAQLPGAQYERDRNAWQLLVANGVLDLRTGSLMGGADMGNESRRCPVSYQKDAPAPAWLWWLSQVCSEDWATVGLLQRAIGCGTVGDGRDVSRIWLVGLGGSDWTALQAALCAALGSYVSLPDDEAMLLRGQRWQGTDELPMVQPPTSEGERIVELSPAPVGVTAALRSAVLAEASGVLAWVVRGCLAWRQHGGVGHTAAMTCSLGQMVANGNSALDAFLAACCVTGRGMSTNSTPLYRRYREWIAEQSLLGAPMTHTMFGRRMGARFKRCWTPGGRAYVGIGLE